MCRHCTWTYHLNGPGIDFIQKHEGSCQVAMDVETLTQLGTYFDSQVKGAGVTNVTVGSELEEADKSVAEKSQGNGIANNGAREFKDHNNVPVEEQNHNFTNGVTGNGSNSHLSSGKTSGNGSKRIENEIQEDNQLKPGESSKFIVEEFDVERVLEEQETHDLYCPNCHSCITKRVILRKRKRTQNPSDLPPQKVPHVPEASPVPNETTDHEDETVFRCLSCFSFFIPAGSGFNIFRFFGKRNGGRTEAGVSLPAESNAVSNGDTSMGSKEYPPLIPKPDAADLGEKGTTSGMNNAGQLVSQNTHRVPFPAESNTVSNGETSLGSKEFPPLIPKPDAADLGEKGTTSGMNNAGSSATQSYPNGGVIENQSPGGERDYPSMAISKGNGSNKPGLVNPPFHDGNSQINGNINSSMPPAACYLPPDVGTNINKPVSMVKPTSPRGNAESNHNICGPDTPAETSINMGVQGIEESRRDNDWDVLKSIVYGGLTESITSLSVVSSAAGAGSSTLNICALGLANLIGGLFLFAHHISELRSAHDAEATSQRGEQIGRYWEKLGKRKHYRRHVVVSLLSYIIFGLLPPVIYGFAFRKSDNEEFKLIAVAISSLLCVALLAIGKAHTRPQKYYIKSLFYYLGIAVPASGLSYVAGVMIDRLLVELGLFDPNTAAPSPPSSMELFRIGMGASAWASL